MDDLISRQALYEKMSEAEELAQKRVIDIRKTSPDGSINPIYAIYKTQLNERTRFKEMIYDEPSAERKKGKWIAQKGGGYCCSECGSYSLDEVDGAFVHVSVRTRYCHNCGVKMEESDE